MKRSGTPQPTMFVPKRQINSKFVNLACVLQVDKVDKTPLWSKACLIIFNGGAHLVRLTSKLSACLKLHDESTVHVRLLFKLSAI